jgi:hypothetical protein
MYRHTLRMRLSAPVELADLAVTGDDLREAVIPPGPLLGVILTRLLDEVIEEPSRNTREWLIARALELYRERSDPPEQER